MGTDEKMAGKWLEGVTEILFDSFREGRRVTKIVGLEFFLQRRCIAMLLNGYVKLVRTTTRYLRLGIICS